MQNISDDALLEELKNRFSENQKTVTELNVMTEKLQEINIKLADSESLKGHFLSNIRNEINNPLTAILGLAQNLMGDKDIDQKTMSELAGMIYDEASDLDSQLRTIFAAAEIEAGDAYLHISRVDLSELIKRAVGYFQKIALKKDIKIIYNVRIKSDPEAPVTFYTDAEKIHLVLSNLLSNALEYGHTGDRVEIATWIDEKLHLSVRDYGIGIDKEDHERIFDRFTQLDQGLTKEYKGHGLGLSVIRNTVDFLGGDISVDSQKGKGSTFTVTIPEAENIENDDTFSVDGNEELF